MKRIVILLLLCMPLFASAQQLKVYTDDDGYKYLAMYAYGLPREIVKTNQEIKDSKFGESGIMRRNHITKYVDGAVGPDGYNGNLKLSFAFLIAPYNVNALGEQMPEGAWQEPINWYQASGWDMSMDSAKAEDAWGNPIQTNNLSEASIAAAVATGCAAYRGPNKSDAPGTWRLPTQRELQVMFTVMEHALTLDDAGDVNHYIVNGKYWSSTELKTSAYWSVWFIDSGLGSMIHTPKIDAGTLSTAFARCVRDIDDDPIND